MTMKRKRPPSLGTKTPKRKPLNKKPPTKTKTKIKIKIQISDLLHIGRKIQLRDINWETDLLTPEKPIMNITENINAKIPQYGTVPGNIATKSIFSAKRTSPKLLPKPTTLPQKLGLRYERHTVKALNLMAHLQGYVLEHNPWFEYLTFDRTWACCVPDALIHTKNFTLVIEIKLTYTPQALEKLLNVYCPVVGRALKIPTRPLVIFKNALRPNVDFRPCLNIGKALESPIPIFQWLGRGPISFVDEAFVDPVPVAAIHGLSK